MRSLWTLILAFFILGIGPDDTLSGGDDTAAGGDDTQAGADDDLDLSAGDDTVSGGDDDPGDDPVAIKSALARERAARKAAEERATNEARAREEAVRRHQPPPRHDATPDERLHEQEERELADPKTDANRRWQIQSNRVIRENSRNSQAALRQAADATDKASFDRLAVTNPNLYKRYEKRVEEEIVRMRSQGQNAPREAVMKFLIGNDALDGKFKKKAAPAAAAGDEKKGVDRGKSPGARSDVRGNGALTDRQKRAKRLDGVNI